MDLFGNLSDWDLDLCFSWQKPARMITTYSNRMSKNTKGACNSCYHSF